MLSGLQVLCTITKCLMQLNSLLGSDVIDSERQFLFMLIFIPFVLSSMFPQALWCLYLGYVHLSAPGFF